MKQYERRHLHECLSLHLHQRSRHRRPRNKEAKEFVLNRKTLIRLRFGMRLTWHLDAANRLHNGPACRVSLMHDLSTLSSRQRCCIKSLWNTHNATMNLREVDVSTGYTTLTAKLAHLTCRPRHHRVLTNLFSDFSLCQRSGRRQVEIGGSSQAVGRIVA